MIRPSINALSAAACITSVLALAVTSFSLASLRGIGRYQLVADTSGPGVTRLDTVTGEVTGCASMGELFPVYSCRLSIRDLRHANEIALHVMPAHALAQVEAEVRLGEERVGGFR
jgi:hypothetical protein